MTKDVEPIYQNLRNQIITLALEPGERIAENELSERFGVSRTPMRDVLKRLEVDGLVTVQPKSGTFVTQIDLEALQDVLSLRTYVETSLMQEVASKAKPEQIEALSSLLAKQKKTLAEAQTGTLEFAHLFFACDGEFHKAMYSLVGKQNVLRLLDESYPCYQRYRYLTNLREWNEVEELIRLHGELLSALKSKDSHRIQIASLRHNEAGLHGIEAVRKAHPHYFL